MEVKRIENLRRDTDTTKSISITLKDISAAIVNHIKDVINPTIEENGVIRKVPVYFATPKRWKTIQADGWFRDEKTKQLLVPALVISRGTISKNNSMPVDKMDGNLRKTVKFSYNKKNRYDIFSVRNELKPNINYYSVTVPDYVNIDFNIAIWTTLIRQMNLITNKFVYAEGSYWGNKYNKFRANYDNIDSSVEIGNDKNRAVKNTFTITVNGYIIPESFDEKQTMIKVLTPAKIHINAEIIHK